MNEGRADGGERRFRHGFVMGKYYPLHAGHQVLIRTALAVCDRVTVLVQGHDVESIPLEVRVEWVRREHPTAHVVGAHNDVDVVDFDSPEVWDRHMRVIEAHLDAPVDAVFTSDDYGAELGRRLGASWVQVDPGRASTPVSGTAVRDDPTKYWWALPTPVREWFTKRVVVLGAVSTGKTALAEALATHFDTLVVPDFGRRWAEVRPGGSETPWHTSEFDLVAREQAAHEDRAAGLAPRPLLICDGDVRAIATWHERLVGDASPTLCAFADARTLPALYLLTDDAGSSVPDGVPWLEVTGSEDERLAAAVAAVDEVVAAGWHLADPLG